MEKQTSPDATLLTSITDMIDLAIGSPECGVIDFNMLHTVLHCLAQQVRIRNLPVELHGDVSMTPLDKNQAADVTIDEYLIERDGEEESAMLVVARLQKGSSLNIIKNTKKVAVKYSSDNIQFHSSKIRTEDERIEDKKPPEQVEPPEPVKSKASEKFQNTLLEESSNTVDEDVLKKENIIIKGKVSEASKKRVSDPVDIQSLSIVPAIKFNALENIVNDLKKKVYGSLMGNDDLVRDVRSQANLKSITDMWTSLNVSSRLKAAEQGIQKLGTVVQDLIGENGRELDEVKAALKEATDVAMAAAATAAASSTSHVDKSVPNPITIIEIKALQEIVRSLRKDFNKMAFDFYTIDQFEELVPDGKKIVEEESKSLINKETDSSVKLSQELMRETSVNVLGALSGVNLSSTTDKNKHISALHKMFIRLNNVERKVKDCHDSVSKDKGQIFDRLLNLQDQLEDCISQIAVLKTGALSGFPVKLIRDLEGLMGLFATVHELQKQLQSINDTLFALNEEKKSRNEHFHAMSEQIEVLKHIKMDREDIREAVAQKADASLVANKVSQNVFETACDDLSRALEHIFRKLGIQESVWQRTLDTIQSDIESKLDKNELLPVKEFFNSKLRHLQDSLRQIAAIRREIEAAGTNKRLLRNVNCISCDAKAVMLTTTNIVPVQKPLRGTLSMKPYLSYELDTVRKSQQCNVQQRNMHDWEQIDKQMGRAPLKIRSEKDKHICNRYCGGNHTVTTPAQRVSRSGHFVKQWGPEVIPLSSALAAGDDGKIYKISTSESESVGPDGAAPTKTGEITKDSAGNETKKPTVTAECRCLNKEFTEKEPDKKAHFAKLFRDL